MIESISYRFLCIFGLLVPICAAVDILSAFNHVYRMQGFPFREDPDFGNEPILEEYDFIVVGSGPGGSVVASRLSENPNWSVLLLEAGEDEGFLNRIFEISPYFFRTEYNWKYSAEPQNGACLGINSGRCPMITGKSTGGSSVISCNFYDRGNKEDFDNWAKSGNTDWSYDDLVPYFLKSEHINIPELKRSPYHETGGPLPIEQASLKSELLKTFLASAKEMNITNPVDYNNPKMRAGFSQVQTISNRGLKVSAYHAFIRPHKNRENLHFAIEARVTKILINPDTKEAFGVEFTKQGRLRTVKARKEVIISAGTFNSPQLLMLSGIGPKKHLEETGILAVIKDLPVGDNLQLHPTFPGLVFTINQNISSIIASKIVNILPSAIDFHEQEDWSSSSMGNVGFGFVPTKYSDSSKNSPADVRFLFFPFSIAGGPSTANQVMRNSIAISEDLYNAVFKTFGSKHTWSIWPILMYPQSRGTIKLRSENPSDPPIIQANLLADPADAYRIVEGIKMIIELSQTEAFQKLGSSLLKIPLPACEQLQFGSDEYWLCCVRQWTLQMFHIGGTCKMGPESDKTAVVDPRLKVYGVKKLRVIDSSIMPTLPGAYPMAAVYMIGQKGADLIKTDWNWTNPIEKIEKSNN